MPVMQGNEVITFTAITPLKPSVKHTCATFLPGVSRVKRVFFPEFSCKVIAVLALLHGYVSHDGGNVVKTMPFLLPKTGNGKFIPPKKNYGDDWGMVEEIAECWAG